MSRSIALRSLACFVLVYGLLIFPWPGLDRIYARYFQELGRLFFSHENDRRILEFDSIPEGARRSLSTRITMANREQLDVQGRGPARVLDLDTRGVGWVPTALIVSLIVSTPVSRSRRGWALVWGLFAVHGLILFSLGVYLWNESTELALLSLSPIWKQIFEGLEETLITQLGASFAIPLLIWIVLVFRREDFQPNGLFRSSLTKVASIE